MSHTATLLVGGRLLVADAGTTVAQMQGYRADHTAALRCQRQGPGGRRRSGGSGLASAEVYDPVKNVWTSAGALKQTRYLHTATC